MFEKQQKKIESKPFGKRQINHKTKITHNGIWHGTVPQTQNSANIDYLIPFGQRNISIKAHKIRAETNEQQQKKNHQVKAKKKTEKNENTNSGSLGCMACYPRPLKPYRGLAIYTASAGGLLVRRIQSFRSPDNCATTVRSFVWSTWYVSKKFTSLAKMAKFRPRLKWLW